MLRAAHEGHYAVGAFNCLSVEHVMGAIAAAEELRSPIIIQLAEVQFPTAPLRLMVPLYLEAARRATVPVVVHLDHGQSIDTCREAIEAGCNSIMYDGASLPYEQNVAITKKVVEMARKAGVEVEAELGKVGDAVADADNNTPDIFTDVEESARFIAETGVDALAIAIGNLHGKYIATPQLNIERLKEINKRNGLPLVLHGGTGTTVEDFKACIHNGISKINVATALQVAATDLIKKYIEECPNPNYATIKELIIEGAKQSVAAHIKLFESDGRA